MIASRAFVWILPLLSAQAPEPSIDPALLQAGQKIVEGLSVLPPGAELNTYFEVQMGPNNAIGYVTGSLKSVAGQDGTSYAYSSDVIMKGLGGQVRAEMRARLKPTFEPLEVTMRRGTFRDGEKGEMAVRADFGARDVILSVANEVQARTQEVPRPEAPVFFAIDMLAQRLDISNREPFALREFSANAGDAGVVRFEFGTWKDGSRTLVVRQEDGRVGYQFWYDQEGNVVRWMHVILPVLFVRCTAERIQEIKAALGEVMRLQVPVPPSN